MTDLRSSSNTRGDESFSFSFFF